MDIRHKEACYCRFTQSKNGRSEYVLYANWRNAVNPDNIEVLPLLDEPRPTGDLQQRMGARRTKADRPLTRQTGWREVQ